MQLRVEVDYERLYFAYRVDGGSDWHWLPQQFDASILSDEATAPGHVRISPAPSSAWPARTWPAPRSARDFDYFEYRERAFNPAVRTSMIRSTS